MSFLKPLGTMPANSAATGLGRLFGADPSRVSAIADRIGKGMNMVASSGGALPGYVAPELPTNHLQMLNPDVLQAILARFRPNSIGVHQR